MLPNSNGKELLNSLSAPAYSIAFTSHLIGLPHWSVGRYLRGYFEYKYRVNHPPVIEQSKAGSTYASFLDLIDLLYVKEFLKRGFTIQYLRRALTEAKDYLGTPHFARSTFYTNSHEIVLKLPQDGALIALMAHGQLTIPQITEMLNDKLDFEDITEFGFVRRWFPHGKNGQIVIDPQIAFGRPIIKGSGIPTQNIYDLYLGKRKKMKPVSNWFNIPTLEVNSAVQFEQSLWG